jgi:drug/metabolite transporter (DMT)-like permease
MFSSKAIFVKLAYEEAPDAAKLLALRMIVSLPFFAGIGVLAYRRRVLSKAPALAGRDVAGALLAGLIGYYVAMVLDFEGLVYINASVERLVLFTYPIFVILLGWGFFGEKLDARSLAAACVTYVGLATVVWQGLAVTGWKTALGSALVLASAISFAVYQLIAKAYISRMGPAIFTSIALSGASAASVVHYAVVSGGLNLSASARFWALAAATGLLATVLPNFILNAGMAHIGAQSTAMISTLSPLITIALAVAVLGEVFTFIDALGAVLVIGGIGLQTWYDMRATPSPR